jgi:DNA repair protein RecO (recombination protein O)
LDLSECAATGSTEDLIYVSPKSGRAVSREAGEPYKAKLLPLPEFLLGGYCGHIADIKETLAGLRLTGYFLEHWLAGPHGKKLPAARQRLIQTMKESDGKTAKTTA